MAFWSGAVCFFYQPILKVADPACSHMWGMHHTMKGITMAAASRKSTDTATAGGITEESSQEEARLELRDKEAEAAKDNPIYEADEKPSGKSVSEEFLDDHEDALIGVDGKNPVSFFNPAPKALGQYERTATRTDDTAERDEK